MAQAAAWRSDSSSRAPAEIEGMLSQSLASSSRSPTLDHRQRVAGLDGIAFLFEPFDQRAHRHGVAEFRHFDDIGHKE